MATHGSSGHNGHSSHGVGHVVPVPLLAAVLLALLALTWITFAATWFDFGRSVNLWIALIIATVKASLVALYFMHLR